MTTRRPIVPVNSRWLTRAMVGLAALSPVESLRAWSQPASGGDALRREDGLGLFGAGYDGILGTSLDLVLAAGSGADAARAERAILDEVDRLSRILSTYDPSSEISRVMRGAAVESTELAEVLAAYSHWSQRTSGAIAVNMGGVIELWKAAARTGMLPDQDALAAAAQRPRAYNVDALGKGFIIDRAVAEARRFASAGLLNVGGDIRAWGARDWLIGVADPAHPEDNSAPATAVVLREGAIATSGGYARTRSIGGQGYSHLIDPRTLWAIDPRSGATVIAADTLTANALSTAAAVHGIGSQVQFAQLASGAGRLVLPVAAAGAASAPGGAGGAANVSGDGAGQRTDWPAGNQVAVTINFKNFDGGGAGSGRGPGGPGGPPGGRGGRGGGAKRPYMAIWIEDAGGKVVRSLAEWGNQEKYIPELTTWWRKIGGNWNSVATVSRATRAAGTYTLAWDGKDDLGRSVPMGDYKVFVEINREHGGHVVQSAVVTCGREPATAALKETSESAASTVTYGSKAP